MNYLLCAHHLVHGRQGTRERRGLGVGACFVLAETADLCGAESRQLLRYTDRNAKVVGKPARDPKRP